jgi:hypothetical protein
VAGRVFALRPLPLRRALFAADTNAAVSDMNAPHVLITLILISAKISFLKISVGGSSIPEIC